MRDFTEILCGKSQNVRGRGHSLLSVMLNHCDLEHEIFESTKVFDIIRQSYCFIMINLQEKEINFSQGV